MTAYACKNWQANLCDDDLRSIARPGRQDTHAALHDSSRALRSGRAEFYDYSQFDDDPLKDLIAELGLTIRPMGGPAVVMNQRILSNLDDIERELGPAGTRAMLEFDRRAKNQITPQEFLPRGSSEGDPSPPETDRFDKLISEIGDSQRGRTSKA